MKLFPFSDFDNRRVVHEVGHTTAKTSCQSRNALESLHSRTRRRRVVFGKPGRQPYLMVLLEVKPFYSTKSGSRPQKCLILIYHESPEHLH